MPRPSARSRAVVATAALVGVLAVLGAAGCAVGPSQRPAVATVPVGVPAGPEAPEAGPAPAGPASPLPPLLPSSPAGVSFADCTARVLGPLAGPAGTGGRDLRVGCGTVRVGGSGPTGPGEIGVVRVTLGPPPAAPLVPVAVLGDPAGRSGSEQAVRLGAAAPPELLSGTALYGVDARGRGASDPVDCATPSVRAALDDADPAAADPAALAPVVRAAATAARTCSQILEDAVTAFRTSSAADDLEEVRQALAAARLNVVGLGGGAAVAADWSRRYPTAVGRTVLDGLPDPTASALLTADQRGEAARGALAAFAADCTARPACPLGSDPAGSVAGLLDRLRAAPLPGPGGRAVTAGTAVTALVDGLGDPALWPSTAQALAAAGRGDPAGILAAVDAREADGGGFDLALATRCNDTTERDPVDQVAPAAARARAVDPVFGSWFVQQLLACASWPVPTDPAAMPAPSGLPLVLGTASDPGSPLPATQRVAAQMRGGTLVTWLGAGHGAFPASPCTSTAATDYLVRGVIPRVGTVCPP